MTELDHGNILGLYEIEFEKDFVPYDILRCQSLC